MDSTTWQPLYVYNLPEGVRISKSEEKDLSCSKPDFVLYVSMNDLGGMKPMSLLYRESGEFCGNSIEDAYQREMEPHYDDGWKTKLIFWAYENQQFETLPYAVSYSAYDGLFNGKYRLWENTRSVEHKDWKQYLLFYAFPVDPLTMFHISVGMYPQYYTTNVVMGVTARDEMFKHLFTFKGLSRQYPGTIPIAVGHTGETDDRRHRVSKGTYAGDLGWTHDFIFHAFEREKPGTIPIAVGHAMFRGGWKYTVSQDNFAGDKGWTHDVVFHAYPSDSSLIIPVAVGFETEHKCAMVRQEDKIEELNYQHDFTFYAFKTRLPGTIPIAVGHAGAEYNRTLRNIVVHGTDAGQKGWTHDFVFYAYSFSKEGTIPVAVGHTDFHLGGWKYRICNNSENASNKDWTHDFVFYVYPKSD